MKMTIVAEALFYADIWQKEAEKVVKKKRNVCDDAAIAVLCLILISITTRLTSPSSSSLTTFRLFRRV